MQRNHGSGGIVIVYSLPERCDSGNSVISTFCNRDIFAVQRISPRRNVPRNENYRKWATFPAAKSEPRQGNVGALGLTTFTGGVRGVCSPLAHLILTTGCVPRLCDERGVAQRMEHEGSRQPPDCRAFSPSQHGSQISSRAAASTIPVTSAAVQANSRMSSRTLVMVRSPCTAPPHAP